MTLLRRPLWSLSVAALWLAIAGSLAWPTLLTACALGLLLPALAGRWLPPGPGLARPHLLLPFADLHLQALTGLHGLGQLPRPALHQVFHVQGVSPPGQQRQHQAAYPRPIAFP